MKKVLLFLFVFAATGLTYGQVMWSDDFESYNDGDLLAASSSDWRTWNNSTAATADAPISTTQAFSGKNSVHIYAANAVDPGPMDIILSMPASYTTGVFHYEMMLYVEGTGAYFNFQGLPAEGTAWTLNSTFSSATGLLSMPEASASVDFPVETWFKIEIDVDLTLNLWVASMDGNEIARWSGADNRIGGINLFPLAGQSYYVDDVMYSHNPFIPATLDLGIAASTVPPRTLEGKDYNITTSVKNLGVTPINSFDISWSDGVNTDSKSVTGTNITILGEEEVTFDGVYTANSANNKLTFTISNINGGTDDQSDNDTRIASVNVVTPAPDKAVFVEEGTGTWCQFCPHGAVAMERMKEEYGDYFVGVAVHNRATDPMLLPAYDAGVTTFPGFGGFPNAVIERNEVLNPLPDALENVFFDYITTPTVSTIQNDVDYDHENRIIAVKVSATFKEDVSGDYRFFATVREDNVTGTESGYAQVNAYAGGGRGEMGGYENLPTIVPASLMVYNEVARALLTPFGGEVGSLPTNIAAGETHSATYSFIVPEDQDPTQMAIASVVLGPGGVADNAKLTYYQDWSTISNVNNVETHEAFIGIAPNPAEDITYIKLDLPTAQEVSVQIFNNVGQAILSQQYGQLSGVQAIPFRVGNLTKGIYHAKINIGNEFVTRSIVVQ